MKKRIGLLLCLFAFTMLSFFGGNRMVVKAALDEATAKDQTLQFLQVWNTQDFSTYATEYADYMTEEDIVMYEGWDKLQKSLGAFVENGDVTITESEDGTHAIVIATYENGKTDFEVIYDADGNMSNVTVSEHVSSKANLGKAGLNTIMGLGIVFVVLVLISFIISLMGFIPKVLSKMEAKKAAELENYSQMYSQMDSQMVSKPVVMEKVEDVTDDLELVAVITAAITASMEASGVEVPVDGLVVRSIKKRSAKKWQSA
ncbi:OadG family transporter subunit [Anaeromicropila populeti]|nr:OadG family transporter subunit [Anaeromicropila populeti]